MQSLHTLNRVGVSLSTFQLFIKSSNLVSRPIDAVATGRCKVARSPALSAQVQHLADVGLNLASVSSRDSLAAVLPTPHQREAPGVHLSQRLIALGTVAVAREVSKAG